MVTYQSSCVTFQAALVSVATVEYVYKWHSLTTFRIHAHYACLNAPFDPVECLRVTELIFTLRKTRMRHASCFLALLLV